MFQRRGLRQLPELGEGATFLRKWGLIGILIGIGAGVGALHGLEPSASSHTLYLGQLWDTRPARSRAMARAGRTNICFTCRAHGCFRRSPQRLVWWRVADLEICADDRRDRNQCSDPGVP